MRTFLKTASLAILLAGSVAAVAGEKPQGSWDAQLIRNGNSIPFRLDIAGEGSTLKGTLYDGFKPYEYTTSASYKDGKLVLNIEHYLTTITAKFEGEKLVGDVVAQNRGGRSDYQFVAIRHDAAAAAAAAAVPAPSISGAWEIPLSDPSSKGEKAFRLSVEQRGAAVAANIVRIDGDTGSYSGTYKDGKWVLSHFDGSRPGVIEVTPTTDGTLEILQRRDGPQRVATSSYSDSGPDGRYSPKLIAYRPAVARAKGFPEPSNHLTHTVVNNGTEKFTFSFPDVDGKQVTSEDPHFSGKVVLAIVTGTWCPNCHDEAQYLVELDRKYRDQGLSIVALNFEEVEQQDSLHRARAFIKQYGVTYPYLIAGAPEEMWEKVPQLVNLNTWPATVFVGRDGKVRDIHSGFVSPSTGDLYKKQLSDFESRIVKLLAENASGDQKVSATSAEAAATVASNR